MKITGQCACGRTSYEIADDSGIDIANCHCAMCRESTGGAYVTWATVPLNRFRWTGELPKTFSSSEHGKRFFCNHCGAQLALFTEKSPDTIDVTVTTFSNPETYPPARDIWLNSKLPWTPLDPNLPGQPEETYPANCSEE
jgi:hypothetical protein